MKIVTWNVNGIHPTNTNVEQLLHALDADIALFQVCAHVLVP